MKQKEDKYVLHIDDAEEGDEFSKDIPHMASVANPKDAARTYSAWVEEMGFGADDAPPASVYKNGERFLVISYNGKLWNLDGTPYKG